jgi:acetyltransferase-like isoleucine patch superfamily enzyme
MNPIRRLRRHLWLGFARRLAHALAESKAPSIFGPRDRLHLGEGVVVQDAFFNLASGTIDVGPYAFFGFGAMVLTGTHDISRLGHERQITTPSEGRDIVIGTGAWIASGAIIIGPATIGEHAVVGAGAVVRGTVAPYAIVSGNPAVQVGTVRPHTAADAP